MKRLLLILAIAILFSSCSNDDDNQQVCSCNGWVRQEDRGRTSLLEGTILTIRNTKLVIGENYRAELNRKNRESGTYGNGDGKDASHCKCGGMTMEAQNLNW